MTCAIRTSVFSGSLLNLDTTTETVGNQQRLLVFIPNRGQKRPLSDFHGNIVMGALEPERPCHTEILSRVPQIYLHPFEQRFFALKAQDGLVMAMRLDHRAPFDELWRFVTRDVMLKEIA